MAWDFKQHVEPLVERNRFVTAVNGGAGPAGGAVPAFDTIHASLPVPVLPADAPWTDLYWFAWRSLWERLCPPKPAAGIAAPTLVPSRFHGQDIETTAYIARLAGYSQRAIDLVSLLDNFYARQAPSGFISREFDPDTGAACFGPFEPSGTGPSLFSWAEWRHFRLTADEARLRDVFWPMVAYHRWCRLNRTWPDGLYWATGYSSGLVNQPRVPRGRFHHCHWVWADASLQAALVCTILGRIATRLEETDLAEEFAAERTRLIQAINANLWNDETSFYHDVAPDGSFSPVKSIAAYWALLDRQLVPAERLTPFVQLLRETWAFKTPFRLPSMSADSEGYEPESGGNGWRGAVWPHLTYMTLRGLHSVGQQVLSHEIAAGHLDAVAQVYQATGSLWASYAPDKAAPGDPAEIDRSGLTAASIILMVLENVLGLSVDWPLRQIAWHNLLPGGEDVGVHNYPLGQDGTMDLLSNGERLFISTDIPVTLTYRDSVQEFQVAVPAGASEFPLA